MEKSIEERIEALEKKVSDLTREKQTKIWDWISTVFDNPELKMSANLKEIREW